jgi:hypothetical protein
MATIVARIRLAVHSRSYHKVLRRGGLGLHVAHFCFCVVSGGGWEGLVYTGVVLVTILEHFSEEN